MDNSLSFPRLQIEQNLRAWWRRKTASPLFKKKGDPKKTGGNVFDIQPEVSSVQTIEVLLEVEKILGFELKVSQLVKRGGYRNCEEFIQHLLPCLEKKFNERCLVPIKTQEGVSLHVT